MLTLEAPERYPVLHRAAKLMTSRVRGEIEYGGKSDQKKANASEPVLHRSISLLAYNGRAKPQTAAMTFP